MRKTFWKGRWRVINDDDTIGPEVRGRPSDDDEIWDFKETGDGKGEWVPRQDAQSPAASKVFVPPVSGPPGAPVAQALRISAWVALGAGVLGAIAAGGANPPFAVALVFSGGISCIACLGFATIIDLLRILATKP